jgi:diguanylate cyclase (GGDEF)-like protein/PAS domain S-box-containing protein
MKKTKKRRVAKRKKKEKVVNEMDSSLCKTVLDNLYDGVYFIDNDRKITYWNKAAEKLTGYRAAEVMGKHCSDGILMHLNGKGEKLCLMGLCPAKRVLEKGKVCEEDLYLHHKNGHRVYIFTRMTPIVDVKGNITGAIEIFSDNSRAVIADRRNERLRKLAMLDSLTELGNRRYAEINLRARLHELRRYGWPFGILFIDIDHFKQVNDKYSHEIGDKVLKMVAKTFSNNARPFDVFCRWGGEEFLGIIANVNEANLFLVANRFRGLIEQSSLSTGSIPIRVTVSIGATTAQVNDTTDDLLRRADTLMYHSKNAGINRISME